MGVKRSGICLGDLSIPLGLRVAEDLCGGWCGVVCVCVGEEGSWIVKKAAPPHRMWGKWGKWGFSVGVVRLRDNWGMIVWEREGW